MKILFCHHTFSAKVVGGSQLGTHELAKELIRMGHQVCVAYVNPVNYRVPNLYKIQDGKFRGVACKEITYQLTPEVDKYLWLSNPPVERAFERIFRDFRPDIFHIELLWQLSLRIPLIARKFKIPTIFTIQDFFALCLAGSLWNPDGKGTHDPEGGIGCFKVSCYKQQRGMKPYSEYEQFNLTDDYIPFEGKVLSETEELNLLRERFQLSLKTMNEGIDMIDSPSKFVRQKFIESGVDRRKIVYLSYGLDLKRFGRFERKRHKGFVFGFLGRLAPYKGVKFLIDTFNMIADSHIKLLIAGSGTREYESFLKKRVKNLNIKFVGRVSYQKVPAFLGRIDALIIPSLWNDTPFVALEAQQAKVPILASNMETLKEWINDGINGLIFKAGDSGDLISKIKRLTAEPGLIKSLGSNAPKVRGIAEVADEYEKIYQRLVHARKAFEKAPHRDSPHLQ